MDTATTTDDIIIATEFESSLCVGFGVGNITSGLVWILLSYGWQQLVCPHLHCLGSWVGHNLFILHLDFCSAWSKLNLIGLNPKIVVLIDL